MIALHPHRPSAFTLIELLVVVSIVSLLISILLPALSGARAQARGIRCSTNLHSLGQGMAIYTNENRDALIPGRLPRIDDCNSYADINGGRKYRPSFLAMMSAAVDVPPFGRPMVCRNVVDPDGQPGDRQNYASPLYVCPVTPEWTDERNGSYGYNYQFLGNSRLRVTSDPTSYKNWPVRLTQIHNPGRTVAAADGMGTAASFPEEQRREYENNANDEARYGNEGFNLDPPRVDPANGEMAGFDSSPQTRTTADPRHRGKASVLWLDGHADAQTLRHLGYTFNPNGSAAFDGNNSLWSGNGEDVAWTLSFRP